MAQKTAVIALYALDMDVETTSSRGIYNYTQHLIAALTQQPDPGFRIELWLSSTNANDLRGDQPLPPWMRTHVVRGRFGSGWRRLYADHCLCPLLALRRGVRAVHFPKGWTPWYMPPSTLVIATLHDTIIQHYQKHHPGFWSRSKLCYFDWCTRHTLRTAHRVITDSESSARELAALVPDQKLARVIYLGPGLAAPAHSDTPPREGILILGSRLPHKATRLSLERLDHYARATHQRLGVTVTGLHSAPPEWRHFAPTELDIAWTGRLSNADLSACMRRHRALVLMSEIEGFGLPAVEAYAHGLPVCYRDATSLTEIMHSTPGGCAGDDQSDFDRALDQVLAMSPDAIRRHRAHLLTLCNWKQCVAAVTEEYHALLATAEAPTDPRHHESSVS